MSLTATKELRPIMALRNALFTLAAIDVRMGGRDASLGTTALRIPRL